jgi:hypothetical protein
MIWTKDICLELAKSFKNRSDFKNNDPTAWRKARKNGWLEEIYDFMIKYHNW